MLKIYSIPISLYCAKLRIVLRNKQLRWQEIAPPGGYGSQQYKNIVASGNLPALVDGDNLVGGEPLIVADSEAIGEYLNEKFPDPPMLPPGLVERAKVRELSRFHDTRLEPELRKLFAMIAPAARDGHIIDQQSHNINQRLGQLARMFSQASFGNKRSDNKKAENEMLTLADCGYPISFAWIEQLDEILELGIKWPPTVASYSRRIGQFDAVHAELGNYQPKLAHYLQSATGNPE